MNHAEEVQFICDKALCILKMRNVSFRPMVRRKAVDSRKGYMLGRTNLKTGLITIDIYTARKRENKKISSILRVLCHEVAHHQKKPYRQLYRRKWIVRQHYPAFYRQVNKNVEKLKKDREVGVYFQ